MKSFTDHLLEKQIETLAEECVRKQLPIVGFVEWYELEGQYLKEYDAPLDYQPNFWGSVGSGAAAGAGVGAMTGGWGALPGAVGGGLMGAGKYMWDKWRQKQMRKSGDFEINKQQAIKALQKMAAMSPNWKNSLGNMINWLGNMKQIKVAQPERPQGPLQVAQPAPAGSTPDATAVPANTPVNP